MKSPLLISWIAWNNDFVDGDTPKTDGPTANLHKYYWRKDTHTRHLLLAGDRPDSFSQKANRLKFALEKAFPDHPIELCGLAIADPTDFDAILLKVETLLASLPQDHPIEAYISPGTPTMQAVWYLLYLGGQYPLRLIQGYTLQDSIKRNPNARTPIFEEVQVQRTEAPGQLLRKALSLDKAGQPATHQVQGEAFVGPSLEPVYARARKVARGDTPRKPVHVLIQGPTGAGKENLARFVHQESPRATGPFLAINCGAFSDNLLESRLFGYKKGAFTGAERDTPGLFAQAEGGTLFMDEIGEISPYMQQALLRVLQLGEYQRIGDPQTQRANVRVVAATNRDLAQACAEGSFRWDLFYRLATAELELPALKTWPVSERMELLEYLLASKARDFAPVGKTTPQVRPLQLDKTLRRTLEGYDFPGNIREMENLVINFYVFREDAPNGVVPPALLPLRLRDRLAAGATDFHLETAIRKHVHHVWLLHNRNYSATQKALGITFNTLKKYLGEAPKPAEPSN
jgi:transcriptional regulator with PAS, ATPase and Fis domain